MIELTLSYSNNDRVYINENMITSFARLTNEDFTTIYVLTTKNKAYYTVLETPQEIMRLIAKENNKLMPPNKPKKVLFD